MRKTSKFFVGSVIATSMVAVPLSLDFGQTAESCYNNRC